MGDDLKVHVAFADDHNLMRKALIPVLQCSGEIIVDIEAENGKELLDKLEVAVKLPDVCIIDVYMPVMDGFTAMREIRKRWPHMKVLILTAYSYEMFVIRLMQAGVNGYLLKKCSEDELKEAVLSIHTIGYYYSEWANSTLFHLVNTNSIKKLSFSDVEIELLKYCCTELSYEEIAKKMKTTFRSVESHRKTLFSKLHVGSRVELVMFAIQFGLVQVDIIPFGKSMIAQLKTK